MLKQKQMMKIVQTVAKTRCPHCGGEYEMGKTGTVKGCDECQGIVRNVDGMIIQDDFSEMFRDEAQS